MEKEIITMADHEIFDQNCEAFSKAFVSLLAETFHLYLKTQYFFWNSSNLNLENLKHVFEGQSLELAEATEEIAKRIRTIGFYAPASFPKLMKVISLENRTAIPDAPDMIQTLVNEHGLVMRLAETVLVQAEELGDPATVSLLNDRLRSHQRAAWVLGDRMIRSEIIFGMKETNYEKIKTLLFQDSI